MSNKEYAAGLKFLLYVAVKDLFDGEVFFHHSLDKGIYTTIECKEIIDKEKLLNIKNYMKKLVDKDIPIVKRIVKKEDAYKYYKEKNALEKMTNVLNISNVTVSLFELNGKYNYFYTHNMVKSTGELKLFDLYFIEDNKFILVLPTNDEIIFNFRNKIYESFREYDSWLKRVDINYVMDLNKLIADGKIKDFIRKNDIMIERNLEGIAEDIVSKNKRIVLLAGPSSSGKTTTSKKLSLYLSSLGVNAIPISLDDFFLNRNETPVDEYGNKDYESINALDLKLFNKVLTDLMSGNKTYLPSYNFITGEKEMSTTPIVLNANDCLVIEGLHGLNPNLISSEYQNLIYKIYISPLTPLNVDRHNYVSTTENRLLRRIIRDFRTRGKSGEDSLASWESVRRGEEAYIFPYTDSADAIINTAYTYEIGVLKVYVEPILYSIDINSKYYNEARRIIDHLKTFYPIPSEYVSEDNLLREFIGGSSFE